MDWRDVAKLIAPFAPVLGGILGGFIPVPGGAIAGQALGNVIARSLGVPATPEAVGAAVRTTENDVLIARLTAAAEEARAQWPAYAQAEEAYYTAQAKLAESVNVTMRAELAQQHWFYTGWRPAAGWVFVLYATVFGAILMGAGVAAAFFGVTQALDRLTAAWPIYASYFGTLAAMVGVYIVARSADKARGVDTSVIVPTPTPAQPAKPPVRR